MSDLSNTDWGVALEWLAHMLLASDKAALAGLLESRIDMIFCSARVITTSSVYDELCVEREPHLCIYGAFMGF
jgi:hypothetical protein